MAARALAARVCCLSLHGWVGCAPGHPKSPDPRPARRPPGDPPRPAGIGAGAPRRRPAAAGPAAAAVCAGRAAAGRRQLDLCQRVRLDKVLPRGHSAPRHDRRAGRGDQAAARRRQGRRQAAQDPRLALALPRHAQLRVRRRLRRRRRLDDPVHAPVPRRHVVRRAAHRGGARGQDEQGSVRGQGRLRRQRAGRPARRPAAQVGGEQQHGARPRRHSELRRAVDRRRAGDGRPRDGPQRVLQPGAAGGGAGGGEGEGQAAGEGQAPPRAAALRGRDRSCSPAIASVRRRLPRRRTRGGCCSAGSLLRAHTYTRAHTHP
jgi:hypothetical protein